MIFPATDSAPVDELRRNVLRASAFHPAPCPLPSGAISAIIYIGRPAVPLILELIPGRVPDRLIRNRKRATDGNGYASPAKMANRLLRLPAVVQPFFDAVFRSTAAVQSSVEKNSTSVQIIM